MKYLPLIWAGLWRKPLRTTLTFLAVVAAFVLFGLVQGVRSTFDSIVTQSHVDRLYVINRLNQNGNVPLPISDLARIGQVPGVVEVTPLGGLSASYQDPKNFIFVWAVDPAVFFDVFNELQVPRGELATWQQNRTSALVGRVLAEKYGWKVGDRVPLRTTTLRQDGGSDWAFDIVGIVDDPGHEALNDLATRIYIHYAYLDEERVKDRGNVAGFIARIADPAMAAKITAAIDKQFAGSSDETETNSEKDFAQSILAQVGNIKLFATAIILAVFFTLLFLTGNTVTQSVRERTNELATLMSIGFSDRIVQALVVAEMLILCIVAAFLALTTVWALFPLIKVTNEVGQPLDPYVVISGFATAIVLALVTAVVPARRVGRMAIVDALAGR